MAQPVEPERIDTLLALSIAFGHDAPANGVRAHALNAEEEADETTQFGLFDALNNAARQSLERRGQWYAKLAPDKQSHWLARTLARANNSRAQLDEHVHPSHILEALSDEPPRVRALILRYLPPSFAAACASAFDPPQPAPVEPPPQLVALVRKVFLSNFVTPGEVGNPSPLESLTGVELARLVRLLGVHETAVACRGIGRAEAIGSFLRRFSAENARAILTHMATLVKLEPARVTLAEGLVHEALEQQQEPEAMLDWLGMRVLAASLAARDSSAERAAYVAQKLPLEAARALRRMVADCSNRYEHTVLRDLGREAESLAQSLRHLKTPRAGGATKEVTVNMPEEAFEVGT